MRVPQAILIVHLLATFTFAGEIPVAPDNYNRFHAWPKDAEKEFAARSREVIEKTKRMKYGNTFFENEKRAYGWAMLSLLGGYEEPALKFLQEKDNQADTWHKHTAGIDYFACFTLKHQVRKLFYFGDRLDVDYRKQMLRGAKLFTEKDPLRRPHHAYNPKGSGVWGPDGKNSWVDVRNTDNLRLMRETSVYLLAEASGNTATQAIYKDRLKEYVILLYHAGMGEWDSENYLGHSMAPLLNLYDFAKDDEIKKLAKAALDWMCISGALKYRRGNYAGPTKRDYNHPYPFGGSAAGSFWLWFGDTPLDREDFESDEIHQITSSYRPPAVALEIAKKKFNAPVEFTRNHPQWAPWEVPLDEIEPEYRETHYIGKSFQFGTLLRGTQNPDVNGFTILADHSKRGADTILAAPCTDPLKLGSPQYQHGLLAPNCWVAQNGNTAFYLSAQSDQPFLFLVPKDATLRQTSDVSLLETEATTIAIWPINLENFKEDSELTTRVQWKVKKDKKTPLWTTSKVISAKRKSSGYYGFAIEIAEGKSARQTLAQKASGQKPETDELPIRGAVAFTGVSGKRLRLQSGTNLNAIKIWRDGKLRDWNTKEENASFRTISGGVQLQQDWRSGTLTATVGMFSYRCSVDRDGNVSWN